MSHLGWKDIAAMVVDVAIVYYVTYRVLLLFKGTRAVQILVGLILFGGGFFLAKQLHLATVSWLLDNLASYGILLVIIVFQQDIRRVILRVARNLFGSTRVHDEIAMWDQVIQAVVQLGHATVIVEREMPLAPLVAGGWEVDAKVTRELLVALAPSGAVLLRDLRVARAGCTASLDALARESDAMALQVGDGVISLLSEGRIQRGLDDAALRKALLGKPEKLRAERVSHMVDAGAKPG
jgi:DNA integrity scanning protein DisA with diadenylate cyclase activity